MSKEAYETWSRAVAFALKIIGILGIVFVAMFWALTGRLELAFPPFFASLAFGGQGLDVLRELGKNKTKDEKEDV